MAAEDWTEERIKVLTKLWAEGRSASVIGAKIGMSRNAVIGKRIRLGLPDRGGSGGRRRDYASSPLSMPLKPPRDLRVQAKINVRELRRLRAEMEAAAKAQPEPKKQVDDGAPPPLMIPLMDLTDQMCRWPVNSPERGDEFLFCAHEKERGSPYCSFHESIAWVGRPHARATRPMRKAA